MRGGAPAELVSACRETLEGSIDRNGGDALLLSGGLDTNIIAYVAARRSKPECYTVAFPPAEAPDVPFARSTAERLGLPWNLVELAPSLLHDRLREVIGVLRTFDPMEVRNSVAIYHGLEAARRRGASAVMTGDAADELFAGYRFTFELEPAEMTRRLREMWRVMHFSSKPMAASLGMSASLPYLDPEVVGFAELLEPGHLVGLRGGKKYGKLILRQAFVRLIGAKNAWRVKTPIEYGSGTTHLQRYFSARFTDTEFAELKGEALADGVKIRDKEHLEYYRIYREWFPAPSAQAKTERRCPDCGADVLQGSTFCVTCGAYPIANA